MDDRHALAEADTGGRRPRANFRVAAMPGPSGLATTPSCAAPLKPYQLTANGERAKDPALVSSAQDIRRNRILKRLEETERPK